MEGAVEVDVVLALECEGAVGAGAWYPDGCDCMSVFRLRFDLRFVNERRELRIWTWDWVGGSGIDDRTPAGVAMAFWYGDSPVVVLEEE